MRNIDELLNEAASVDYFVSAPILNYTVDELCDLTENAKEKGLTVIVSAEHSNLYQGTMVSVIKTEILINGAEMFLR